jgi:MFS superfamily sulfate permease-like transporter
MLNLFPWSVDWAWSLPLIVLTVVIHVSGLALLGQAGLRLANRVHGRSDARFVFMLVLGGATLFATCLHGIEVAIWASAYYMLGALPDLRSSVLYSLNAMTSYGHTNLSLEYHWQLMGALEAMNGWLLFGLTTAFLFGVVQKLWLLSRTGDGEEHRS